MPPPNTININTGDVRFKRSPRTPAGPHPGGPPGGPASSQAPAPAHAPAHTPTSRKAENTPPAEVRFKPNPKTLAWFASAKSDVQEQSLESFYMTTPYRELSDPDLMGCIEYFRDRRRKATEQKRKRTVSRRESQLADAATGVRGSTINKILKQGDMAGMDDFVVQAMTKKFRDQGLSEGEIEDRLAQIADAQRGKGV